jgi:hypothetical protein
MSIKSKSNQVRGTKDMPACPAAMPEPSTLRVALETNGAPPTTPAGQRIEQMRQLADIFASIFEALPDEHEHEHAIATTRQAA